MIMIREAEQTDLQGLIDLYAVLYGKTKVDGNDELKGLWNRIMTDKYYHVLVADIDGYIASTCSCIIIPNLTYEQRPFAIIENLVTDSNYRAQGLATALLDEAKRISEKENCYKMVLCTTSKLESTMRFYENVGFSRKDLVAFSQWF